MSDKALVHAQQQMLMKRPWDAAEPESVWEITGIYPKDGGTFTQCVAFTLSPSVTGVDSPVFVFAGALSLVDEPVPAEWVTHARPLLLVHRDDPTEPYYEQDWVYMPAVSSREEKEGRPNEHRHQPQPLL